jgi:hypothetical protein
MAILEAYSGTATIGITEWSLTGNDSTLDAIALDGVFQPHLDLSALDAGDVYKLTVYETVVAGGTQRVTHVATFAGIQGEPHWVGPSFLLLHGWDMSMVKISGADRSISWSLRMVA